MSKLTLTEMRKAWLDMYGSPDEPPDKPGTTGEDEEMTNEKRA